MDVEGQHKMQNLGGEPYTTFFLSNFACICIHLFQKHIGKIMEFPLPVTVLSLSYLHTFFESLSVAPFC